MIIIVCLSHNLLLAQQSPKDGMIYDAEAMLYYKVSHDREYLHVALYKDEYAQKISIMPGGAKFFFNLDGKRDTLKAGSIQYPVYKRPKDWEVLEITGFSGIPEGELSVYNEFGIIAEASIKEMSVKEEHLKMKYGFAYEGKISIPLAYLSANMGDKICIQIFLKGQRPVPLPPGRVSPVLISKSVGGTGSRDVVELLAHVDTWSHTWIDYELK